VPHPASVIERSLDNLEFGRRAFSDQDLQVWQLDFTTNLITDFSAAGLIWNAGSTLSEYQGTSGLTFTERVTNDELSTQQHE
jgi:hypothetical protein